MATLTPKVVNRAGVLFTDSRDVATIFERRHDNVLRDIDNLLINLDTSNIGVSESEALFWETSYTIPGQTRPYRAVEMSKSGFMLLAMGFTGPRATKFKIAYIRRFDEMEAELRAITSAPSTRFSIRAAMNEMRADPGFFTVIGQTDRYINQRLETLGYRIPEYHQTTDGKFVFRRNGRMVSICPDISVGRRFVDYLREHNRFDILDSSKQYKHLYLDGRVFDANQYPMVGYPAFDEFMNKVYIPKYAAPYLRKRAPQSIPYLKKLVDYAVNGVRQYASVVNRSIIPANRLLSK